MTTPAKVILALLLLGLIVLGGKCYGDARAKEAVAIQKAMIQDSTAATYAVRYQILRDSAKRAVSGAEHVRDSAVAASRAAASIATKARANADAARQQYAALTASDTATASPAVKATLHALATANDNLTAANDSLTKANKGLLFAIDSMSTATTQLYTALGQADSTITQYRATVTAFEAVKTPKSHPVVRALEFVGVGVAAFFGGRGTK